MRRSRGAEREAVYVTADTGEHGVLWKNEEIGLFAVVVVALWEREFSGRWSTGWVGRIGRIRRGGGGFRIRGGPWR
jgi:hypothetical protein